MKHGTRTPASPRYHPPYISQDGTTHSVIVGYGPIDVWYDCEGCMHEAVEWASDHGFSQCVSPDIKREGTDNGLWVTAHHKRWTLWDRHEVAHGVVISNDWFGDRLNWWFGDRHACHLFSRRNKFVDAKNKKNATCALCAVLATERIDKRRKQAANKKKQAADAKGQ